MKTVYLVIDRESPGDADYRLRLFTDESGAEEWHSQPSASAVLSADLTKDARADAARAVLHDPNVTGTQLEEAGGFLFELFGRGDVGAEWERLRHAYPREQAPDEGLRVFLDVVPPELRSLPWELARAGHRRLSADPLNPFARGRLAPPAPDGSGDWPLKILVVVGSAANDAVVRASEEVEGIREALRPLGRDVWLDVSERPSRYDLRVKIETFKPHVLHFVGHGREGQQYPYLEFSNPDERWRWSANEIETDLAVWAPRLAFLNACRTANALPGGSATSIMGAFAAARVAAVLSVSGAILGHSAAALASHIYAGMAQGIPLDRALADARRKVASLPGVDYNHPDWARARLEINVAPDAICPIRHQIGEDRREKIRRDFSEIRAFVDREEQRETILGGIDPPASPNQYKDLLIVVGDDQVGKTWLVYWCLEFCATRGRTILYVDGKDRTQADALGLLRIVRDGDPDSGLLITQPLPESSFREFNWRLNHLAVSREPPPLPAGDGPIADEGAAWDGKDPRFLKRIFQAFRAALQRAAGGEPLILVLDHLRVRSDHLAEFVLPHLVRPVADRECPPVRAVLVVSRSEFESFGLRSIENRCQVVRLESLDADKFKRIACEFLRHHPDKVDSSLIEQVVDLTIANDRMMRGISAWKPIRLSQILRMFDS